MILSGARQRSEPGPETKPTTMGQKSRLRHTFSRKFTGKRALVAMGLGLLVLSACSNSKLLIGFFYDRADNKAIEGIAQWTDLDRSQMTEVRAYIGTVHTWHRKTQLPVYADWIRSMTAVLATENQATPENFDTWFAGMRSHMEAIRQCHPAHYAVPLGRSLTAAQVDQAEATWLEKRAENRARFSDLSRQERIESRVAGTAKFLGRLGFDLDKNQRALIKATMQLQPRMRKESRALSDQWNETFFELLRDPGARDYEQRISAHISDWFGLVERAYPDEWNERRMLWREFAIRFEKTLSTEQRSHAVTWLNKLSRTLDSISKDSPDWTPADDPAYGCVVAAAGTAGGTAGVTDTSASFTR